MTTFAADGSNLTETRKLIAPAWHTGLLLIFLAVPLVSGFVAQTTRSSGGQILTHHSAAMMRFYIPVLVFEWFLVLFVWLGVRGRGMTLKDLVGGRWKNGGSVAFDFILGLIVWISLLAIGVGLQNLLGPEAAKKINIIMPQGPREMAVWVAVAATAGFVEELVFRGYLQTQFVRMGLPTILAIVAQALVFAGGHAYEGLNAVITIAVYGVFFGILAALRRSLRPGIIGHVIFDVSVVFLMGK